MLLFLLQKGLQLVFVVHQLIIDTFQGKLEVGNDFAEEIITDPSAQLETPRANSFIVSAFVISSW